MKGLHGEAARQAIAYDVELVLAGLGLPGVQRSQGGERRRAATAYGPVEENAPDVARVWDRPAVYRRRVWLSRASRAGVSIERRLLPSQGGGVTLAQTFRGDGTRVVVTHAATVLTEISVCQGSLSFPLASAEIVAPARFVLALPARSVLPMRFARARVESRGTARFESPAFAGPLLVAGASLADAPAPWRSASCTWLDADRGVATAVRDARRALHDLIAHPAPVRAAARRVDLAAATLARQFSRAYGLSPKEYCQRARVFEGVLRLLAGARIIDAAFTAGFSDLTRFYVAFRRIVGVTPGVYARVKNRQDGDAGSRHRASADPGP